MLPRCMLVTATGAQSTRSRAAARAIDRFGADAVSVIALLVLSHARDMHLLG